MPIADLTAKHFEEEVKKPGIVIIDFWADWCAPCRAFRPVLEAVALENPAVRFFAVDTEKENALTAAFDIKAIPTILAFRDGILLFEQAGALPAVAVRELIKKIEELNMDEVRAEMAKQKEKEEKEEKEEELSEILFRGLGQGDFTEIYLPVAHIAGGYARGRDGTCALCQGDPLNEKKAEGSVIDRFYAENPDAGTCPVCHGQAT